MQETKVYIHKKLLKGNSKMDQSFKVFHWKRDYQWKKIIIQIKLIDKFVDKIILIIIKVGVISLKINHFTFETILYKKIKQAFNISKQIFHTQIKIRLKKDKIKAGLISI